jgi:hypothetical protein
MRHGILNQGRAWPVLALTFLLGACGPDFQEVHVHLQSRDCGDDGLANVYAVHVVLWQEGTKDPYYDCRPRHEVYASLSRLEARLASLDGISFGGIFEGGEWTIWVIGQGYPSTCEGSQGATVPLCGTTARIAMPPADRQIIVPVACEDPAAEPERLEMIKKKITECRSALPVFPSYLGL